VRYHAIKKFLPQLTFDNEPLEEFMRLRSLLFVPGDRPERLIKAVASGADGVVIDLEDSVSLSNKVKARDEVESFIPG
jgi:citrate lyase subunit beta/citryl-CoA lyase